MDFEVLVTMSLGDQEIQEWVHTSKGGWTHFVVFTYNNSLLTTRDHTQGL